MNMDGEYRTAFIDDQAPNLNYGDRRRSRPPTTTPTCTAAGYITGNIAGISKGSKNPELAWALLKYLTTDTGAVVKLANGLKNVPHHDDALLARPARCRPSTRRSSTSRGNKNSSTTPASPRRRLPAPSRTAGRSTRSGDGGDLRGLKTVDKQINAPAALAGP